MSKCFAVLATAALLFSSARGAPSATIAEVKAAGNWMQVTVDGIVTYLEPAECYIESADRSGGIWVRGSTDGIHIGDSVTAIGAFAVVDGEPAVTGASILTKGESAIIIPFGMKNASVGGAGKWSPTSIWDYISRRVPSGGGWAWERTWKPACGASNTGLLIATWGTVKSTYSSPTTGTRWIYIDDGSSPVSDYGDRGVLIYTDAEVDRGDFVSVTGVSSTEPSLDDSSKLVRVVRTRAADDVRVLRERPPQPEYPFSDEFDEGKLDPRWIMISGPDLISCDTVPGWLTLAPIPFSNGIYSGTAAQLGQPLDGEFELEGQVRIESDGVPAVKSQTVCLWFGSPGANPYDYAAMPASVSGLPGKEIIRVYNNRLGYLQGDTFCFHMRATRDGGRVDVSSGGVHYSVEYSGRVSYHGFVGLEAFASGPATTQSPFRAHVDYFRITRPGQ